MHIVVSTRAWQLNEVPVVLEVVDDVADGRIGAVLQQPHLRPLARPGEVALQSRCSRVKHAVVLVSAGGGGAALWTLAEYKK